MPFLMPTGSIEAGGRVRHYGISCQHLHLRKEVCDVDDNCSTPY